jgi:hypothetical protein
MKLSEKQSKCEQVLLTFLKRTKAGKYAKIRPGSLAHARLATLREENPEQETYLYSTR